jgi:hypothetical protein
MTSLFSDDLRLFILPMVLDAVFNVLVLFNIILFIIEIIFTSLGLKGYFCSFYFFTDIIATITLFFDFGWVYQAMTGTPNYAGSTAEDYYMYATVG